MSVTVKITLSDDQIEELDLLIALCGLSSRVELLNNALTVYQWAANEIMEGGEIAAVYRKRESFTVLETSVFEKLRENVKRIKP
jgi:metal-responsive CopG/Arc/MetJ family transcriptional regulator